MNSTFISGSRQLRAFWFRIRGYGMSIGWHEPLPSSKRHFRWSHVGPIWWRICRPSDQPSVLNDGPGGGE